MTPFAPKRDTCWTSSIAEKLICKSTIQSFELKRWAQICASRSHHVVFLDLRPQCGVDSSLISETPVMCWMMVIWRGKLVANKPHNCHGIARQNPGVSPGHFPSDRANSIKMTGS